MFGAANFTTSKADPYHYGLSKESVAKALREMADKVESETIQVSKVISAVVAPYDDFTEARLVLWFSEKKE